MWFTLLWQNKGLVAFALVALLVVGLCVAVKVQSSRLTAAQEKIGAAERERDIAIEAHDQLVKDWERQQHILNEREELRKQQEAENAKLHKTLREIMGANKAWADAPVPTAIVGVLRDLPEAKPSTSPPPAADASPGLRWFNKPRPSLLGN